MAALFRAPRLGLIAAAAWAMAAGSLLATPMPEPDVVENGVAPVLSLPLRKAFATRADWHVMAYQAASEEGRFGDVPARICFQRQAGAAPAGAARAGCTQLIRAATNDTERLVYQTVTGLSVTRLLRLPLPVNAVLAQAEMSYGGSGTSTQYSLWSYRENADQFQPLAAFQISEQGELQIIDDGKLAGCVITADALLGQGETHFGRHRFEIAVHQLDPGTMTYTELLRYVTSARYPSLDEGGVDVIRPEMPATLRILRFIYPKRF